MSTSLLESCVGVVTHPGLCQIAKETAGAAPTLCTEYGPNGWMHLYLLSSCKYEEIQGNGGCKKGQFYPSSHRPPHHPNTDTPCRAYDYSPRHPHCTGSPSENLMSITFLTSSNLIPIWGKLHNRSSSIPYESKPLFNLHH